MPEMKTVEFAYGELRLSVTLPQAVLGDTGVHLSLGLHRMTPDQSEVLLEATGVAAVEPSSVDGDSFRLHNQRGDVDGVYAAVTVFVADPAVEPAPPPRGYLAALAARVKVKVEEEDVVDAEVYEEGEVVPFEGRDATS